MAILEVSPRQALVDDSISVQVRRGTPRAVVALRARLVDKVGLSWESWAEYQTDGQGRLDLSSAKPLRGSYSEPDSMGLFWSMLPQDPAAALEHSIFGGPDSVPVHLTLSDGAEEVVTDLELRWVGPGVTREPVDRDGLKGALWAPAGKPPFRPVLVFGGSDGGLREETAALLASRGFFCLVIAYFRHPGLPEDLVRIPLEYFGRAIDLLAADPRTDPARGVAVHGRSRGGELALLLGATFPAVDSVVAYVPSGIVHAGIPHNEDSWQSDVPSWTWRGESVPYLPHLPVGEPASEAQPPVRLTPIYCRDLADWQAAERAAIPVERSRARILMISGMDDAMWPSSLFSELTLARLQRLGYDRPYAHLALPQAGHRFNFPTVPGTISAGRHPADQQVYEYGGTPVGNSRAGLTAHRAILEWLAAN